MNGLDETTALTTAAVLGAFFTVFTTTLVLVPKNATALRLAATVAMAFLGRLFGNLLWQIFSRRGYRSNFVMLTCVGLISASEAVLVSRVDAAELSRTRSHKGHPQPGTATLLWRALCLFFNVRRVGTMWEIPYVRRRLQPQSRTRFLATTLARVVVVYLLVDLLDCAPPPDPRLFAEEKQTLFHLGRLSAEDVVTRLLVSAGYWVASFLAIYLNMSVAALVTVLTGLSRPEAWPRLNGPLSSIYTVRGFWGTFWHQSLRISLTGWAALVSDRILRIRRGTLPSRYLRLFLAFLLSGVLHCCMDRAFEVAPGDWASVTFFSLQALGIMAEDCVQAATADLGVPAPVRRVVGYAWVMAFLWWSTPRWFYPGARAGDPGDVAPFSILRRLPGVLGGAEDSK